MADFEIAAAAVEAAAAEIDSAAEDETAGAVVERLNMADLADEY